MSESYKTLLSLTNDFSSFFYKTGAFGFEDNYFSSKILDSVSFIKAEKF
jgi:hypothetical protein